MTESNRFRPFVIDYLYIENGKDVYEHGVNTNSLFGSDNFNSAVAFLLLDGSHD